MARRACGTECCSAINCTNTRKKTPHLSFFRFPKDPERCNLWVLNSGRLDLLNKDITYVSRNYAFCSEHFEVNQCMNEKKNKLIWNAVPTLFKTTSEKKSTRIPKSIFKSKEALKKKQTDSVKRCLYACCRNNTRYLHKDYMENVFFLPVPSAKANLKKRKLWLKLCGRMDLMKDRGLDEVMFYVCSVHFEGGNGPTRQHPDPIPHKVMLKTSSFNNNIRFMSVKAPKKTSTLNDNTDVESSSVDILPPNTELPVLEPDPPSIYTIADIRAKYPVPWNWTLCITLNSIFFAKINEVTQCLLVKFIINKDMTTALKVLCRDLGSDHPIFRDFPKVITDCTVLEKCHLLFRQWRPCEGNNEKAYVSLFLQDQNSNGFFCPQTEAIHSVHCTLLTSEKNSRCISCKTLRVSLRTAFRRFVKTYNRHLGNENENIENENSDVEDNLNEDVDSQTVLKNSHDITYSVERNELVVVIQ